MAEITRRRTGERLRGLFSILLQHPEGVAASEALRSPEEIVPPTPYEAGRFDSGGRRYEHIIGFATVDCVKAGWMVKSHGVWTITEEGRTAYADMPDPEVFYRRAVQLYQVWKKSTESDEASASDASNPNVTDTKTASITFEQAEEQAWSEIERYVAGMPPYEFQELVAALLRGMGYHVGWVAPPGKAGGVDIVAFNDPLRTRPPRIKVQVKRQQARVDVHGLRSFRAVLAADDVGLFVNTGGFTKDAEEEARAQQIRRITLLDLDRLVALWTEHYGRLEEAARRRLPLQPIYFLAPEA